MISVGEGIAHEPTFHNVNVQVLTWVGSWTLNSYLSRFGHIPKI